MERARCAPRGRAPRSIECLLDIPVKTCSPGWQVPLAQHGSRHYAACIMSASILSVASLTASSQCASGDGAEHDGRVHSGAEGVPGGVLRRTSGACATSEVSRRPTSTDSGRPASDAGRQDGGWRRGATADDPGHHCARPGGQARRSRRWPARAQGAQAAAGEEAEATETPCLEVAALRLRQLQGLGLVHHCGEFVWAALAADELLG